MFSLEECSDIEPISEDDEVDGPICEVQVISMNNIVCQPLVEWHCRVPMVTCIYMEIPLVKANCYNSFRKIIPMQTVCNTRSTSMAV